MELLDGWLLLTDQDLTGNTRENVVWTDSILGLKCTDQEH